MLEILRRKGVNKTILWFIAIVIILSFGVFGTAYRMDNTVNSAGTIYGHIATAIESGEKIDLAQLLDAEAQAEIAAAFKRTGWGNIVGAREMLGEKYDYGLLRIFRAAANAKM